MKPRRKSICCQSHSSYIRRWQGKKMWSGTGTLRETKKPLLGTEHLCQTAHVSGSTPWKTGKPCWLSIVWISQDDLPQLPNSAFSWSAEMMGVRGRRGFDDLNENLNYQLGHHWSLQCPLSHSTNGWMPFSELCQYLDWCWMEHRGSDSCFRSICREITLLKIHNLFLELNRLAQDVGLSTVESHLS